MSDLIVGKQRVAKLAAVRADAGAAQDAVTVDTIDDIASVTRASGPSSFSARI